MTSQDIMNGCDSSLKRYQIVVDPIKWSERSILLSEGLLICAMTDLFDVDLFIESGVYEGKSTEIWGRYLANRGKSIIAIDVAIRKGVRSRLEYLTDLSFCENDGAVLLPNIVHVDTNKDKSIGVFIDGPKGEVAVNLANDLIKYDNVKFVAVHDCHKISFGKPNYTRTFLEDYKGTKFFTDSTVFVQQYKHLDLDDIGKVDEEQQARWYPGRYDIENKESRFLGSYGPTVGVIL